MPEAEHGSRLVKTDRAKVYFSTQRVACFSGGLME